MISIVPISSPRAALVTMAVIGLLGGACSGTSPAPAPEPAARVSLIATPAGTDDVEIAKVNGRPVWGSCVAGQLARANNHAPTAADRKAALDECIGFELLAQTAEARGLADDPEARQAARTALVSRMISVGFEDRYRTPADLRDRLDNWISANEGLLHRPELRACSYIRVEVKPDASPEIDQRARKLAEDIAADLRDRTGLFASDLLEAADRVGQHSGLVVQTNHVPARPRVSHTIKMKGRDVILEGLETSFGTALFSIRDLGRTSPAVRTPWGWDVILWTDVLPEEVSTREQLAAKRFEAERQDYFKLWINQMVRALGNRFTVDTSALDRYEAAR